jgi:tRNA-Thr(GGU) m(6)t(6)A37 methyltransferase TsaA
MNPSEPFQIIGVVRTGRHELENTPIQAGLNRAEHGTVEITTEFADGLDGLDGFDYAWLITWLDRPDQPERPPRLRHVPFLLRSQGREVGIFATRGPRRVNPVGLSLVKLIDVTGTQITFAGVDLLDGTPVLDLKPYVTRFDRPPGEPRCGWFNQVALPEGATPAKLGPPPAQTSA